jgi:hypothetical protein
MNARSARTVPMTVDNANYRDWNKMAPPPVAFGVVSAALQAAVAALQVPRTARFRHLAQQWITETENMSSVDDMLLHPAYQEIIAMGPGIISLVLDELEREPNHWFPALYVLSGRQNPVPPQDSGDIDRMVEAWIAWGEANGYR